MNDSTLDQYIDPLTQTLLDIQSMRGQLSRMERNVKRLIKERSEAKLRAHAEELMQRYAHAPGSEDGRAVP